MFITTLFLCGIFSYINFTQSNEQQKKIIFKVKIYSLNIKEMENSSFMTI